METFVINFGNIAPLCATVIRLFVEFKRGCIIFEDGECDDRPSIYVTEDTIDVVESVFSEVQDVRFPHRDIEVA